jgi:hypothetical protein
MLRGDLIEKSAILTLEEDRRMEKNLPSHVSVCFTLCNTSHFLRCMEGVSPQICSQHPLLPIVFADLFGDGEKSYMEIPAIPTVYLANRKSAWNPVKFSHDTSYRGYVEFGKATDD